MVEKIIAYSLRHRLVVLLLASLMFLFGLYSIRTSKIDAIPDLSENQVIIFTEWMGRSPQIIEDQITYPLVTNLQGLPEVKYVRANSMFGMSFIYIIFEDDVDVYWARTRVTERLSVIRNELPEGVNPSIGPDGTGVGHVLWYTLDAPGLNLGEQRTIQDWYVKLALQNVAGVSEIASFGGFQKQYQINIDPDKLSYFKIGLNQVMQAVNRNNQEAGGRKFEMADIGYIIKTTGYLKSVSDLENLTVSNQGSVPVKIRDIASVQMAGESRLGIFDLNGEGEAVGGIVVMRYSENAHEVIRNVKSRMEEVSKGLPKGVKFNIVYDRGELIRESINSITTTLIEEMIVVSLIVIIFLFHWRSAVSIIIQIPITIAASFIVLNAFDITSNIMSLTGIALAISVIVDNGIIMAENSYKHLAIRQAQLTAEEGSKPHGI